MHRLRRLTRNEIARRGGEDLGHGRVGRLRRHVVELVGEALQRLVPARSRQGCHEADREGCKSIRDEFGGDLRLFRQRVSPGDDRLEYVPAPYRPMIKVLRARRIEMRGNAS